MLLQRRIAASTVTQRCPITQNKVSERKRIGYKQLGKLLEPRNTGRQRADGRPSIDQYRVRPGDSSPGHPPTGIIFRSPDCHVEGFLFYAKQLKNMPF